MKSEWKVELWLNVLIVQTHHILFQAQKMKPIGTLKIFCTVILATLLGFAGRAIPMEERDKRLISAVTQKDLQTVQQLVNEGANIHKKDARGRTPLLIAVSENQIEIARILIAAGADVNAQDHIQDSPLLLAGARGYLDILRLILQSSPDFVVYNRYGGTALIPACERGHVEVVKTLLQTKVDINHVNHLGWTALLEAIVLSDGGPQHQEIVQALVDAGANVNISDHDGITPLQHAQKKGFSKIVKILESAGAVSSSKLKLPIIQIE